MFPVSADHTQMTGVKASTESSDPTKIDAPPPDPLSPTPENQKAQNRNRKMFQTLLHYLGSKERNKNKL